MREPTGQQADHTALCHLFPGVCQALRSALPHDMPAAGTNSSELTEKSSQIPLGPKPKIIPRIPQEPPNYRLQYAGTKGW